MQISWTIWIEFPYQRKAGVDNVNVSAYISLAYDSLREAMEAICISKGYKVLSHICIGELLKSLFKEFEYEEFDRLRWIRNSINYYGTKVELKQGKGIISKIFSMKNSLIKKYITPWFIQAWKILQHTMIYFFLGTTLKPVSSGIIVAL